MNRQFTAGIVAALDVVALFDQGVMFKEIVETAGIKETLREIRANGLPQTKKMAKAEFPNYKPSAESPVTSEAHP
jgi:hypothetical protein